MRWVEKVDPQHPENRTEVTLQRLALTSADDPFEKVKGTVQPFQEEASKMFPDNQIAVDVAAIPQNLLIEV